MKTCITLKPILALCLTGVLLAASPAFGDITIPLGGGWQASVPSLSAVGINVDTVTSQFVAIEISKDFTEPSVNGIFPSLNILFTQVAGDAATAPQIVILDESVTNQTGENWTDYHMQLTGPASFDILSSLGFSMSPFLNKTLTLTTLDADNGTVFNNSSFFPGAGAGELVINADLSGGPVTFVLTEYPTPEPATFALMLIGLGALSRRRSR